MLSTALVDSIHQVPAADWDVLAAPVSLYLSHRWLAGEEQDPTATPAYALVRDGRGALLAAAPLYLVHDEPNDNYRPERVLWAPVRPRVIAGARRGYHNGPLLSADLTPDLRDACLAALTDAARSFAAAHGTTHWWPYLTHDAAARLSPHHDRPPLHLADDATIPLPGGGFDDYLASLPGKRRVSIRRERRTLAESPFAVRELSLDDCCAEAGALLAGHQQGHGRDRDGVDAMTALLKRQAQAMGDTARVVAAYDGDRMAGFCLSYHYGATTWVRAVAVDSSRPAPSLYFNLAYYLPIESAYAHGTSALHVGMNTIEAKRLRGAVVSGLYAVTDASYGSGKGR
ncbi:GNAT family N-acetyltransferase [Streptomyces sp. Da 82-17]|uniref:GNAT family N-acetyltransferase n=1 Tax=Streptomyces sp. Da 82-17 TaxID=3377116 RepID=UPI0038D40404